VNSKNLYTLCQQKTHEKTRFTNISPKNAHHIIQNYQTNKSKTRKPEKKNRKSDIKREENNAEKEIRNRGKIGGSTMGFVLEIKGKQLVARDKVTGLT
jgi:predicted Fe-S protein YdhL (DUF1289 family)